jgi:transcriptional regulator with GAF, ATPase, and Fis domain
MTDRREHAAAKMAPQQTAQENREVEGMTREEQIAEALVELADTLVVDYDVVDFMHALVNRSTELLGGDAAGLILSDKRGQLQVMAASTHEVELLELFEVNNDAGPCLQCLRTGRPVIDIDDEGADLPVPGTAAAQAGAEQGHDRPGEWPRFSAMRRAAGYRAVYALPLRLRDEVIGALNLFSTSATPLSGRDLRLAQALADVATIGLLQERAIRERQVLAEQLQRALNTRIVIEQAKGVLAERGGLGMDEAFAAMRSYARSNHYRLTEVAERGIDNTLPVGELVH